VTTIADVRGNLATIAAIPTGEWYGSAYVTDQVNVNQIVVRRNTFVPFMVYGSSGKAEYNFRMIAYAARAGGVDSEAALDALCDTTGAASLVAAVNDSANWSVSIDYAQVTQCGETDVTQYGQDAAEYLANYFDVKVVF
jgi:hypothetical protein